MIVLTFLLVGVGFLQWCTSRNQVKDAEVVQRAFLYIDEYEIIPIADDSIRLHWHTNNAAMEK